MGSHNWPAFCRSLPWMVMALCLGFLLFAEGTFAARVFDLGRWAILAASWTGALLALFSFVCAALQEVVPHLRRREYLRDALRSASLLVVVGVALITVFGLLAGLALIVMKPFPGGSLGILTPLSLLG